ncbi:DapH/DapD/GlmU-related protein [Bacillus sp. AG1163]|uniref:DapH/DapD/GlmU-related protein n=1 Tax=Bacillus sp. AG1163 TaxID=2183999 RepID=UPI0010650BFD|nr:DapH/DapD/GlmU-related protein [Bacillus sp. AG1163]
MINENAKIGNKCEILANVEISANVEIGDYSYINMGSVVNSGKIGKFCSVGYYTQIGGYNHPISYISTSPHTYSSGNIFNEPPYYQDVTRDTNIGNDVWIGSHSVIMQGVNIGHGAIVAAGSVVTKNVPEYSIVAGCPAKVIRRRFDDKQINVLRELKWWDLPLSEIQKLDNVFLAKEEWFEKYIK